MLTESQAAIVNDMLQGVVRYGTGKAAQLPGRQVAGKTGTTENYGDAWFVGYTPQFVAAVWVGYPDKLVPMTTEFHGHPVAGGTFPALIWKAFMTKALDQLHLPPETFTPPDYGYAAPVTVVNRGGVLERDDGVCHNTVQLQFFGGEGPSKVATCKPNEVEIPEVIGQSLATAKSRLQAQPLTPVVVYKPAKRAERLGVVVGAVPGEGHRVRQRPDHDRPTEVDARPRAERRRAATRSCAGEAGADEDRGPDDRGLRRQGDGAVGRAAPCRGARPRDHPDGHRNGRLRNREPASP